MNIKFCNENSWEEDDELVSEKTKLSKISIDIDKVKPIKFSSKPELSFYDINEFTKARDGEEGYYSYSSETNFFSYKFHLINNILPFIYRFENVINSSEFINNLFKYYDIPFNAYSKISYQNLDENKITSLIIGFKEDLILFFDGINDGILYYHPKYEENKNSMLYTILGLCKKVKIKKSSKNKIFIVYRNSQGFFKKGFDIKKTTINLDDNYNNGFEEISSKLIVGLNDKNKTNLVILSGAPGVGKTTFVRYLTSKLKKNIIFISPDMVESITDPAFIPFLMENNNSVLIIEDAEPALEKRSFGGRSSAVSNVLNLTDGLLSDCLNISIVATFNTTKRNIDEALTRKGRLLMNHKFEKLSIEKSKKLLQKLGHMDIDVKEPMTLADIYFYGTDNNNQTLQHKRVGLKHYD